MIVGVEGDADLVSRCRLLLGEEVPGPVDPSDLLTVDVEVAVT